MENKGSKVVYLRGKRDIAVESREIVGKLAQLSGSNALNMVLDHENALELVQNMPKIDFFWLIKKVGEDDSFPLLSLASEEQWQYLLDLETWEKDRMNRAETFKWLNRLMKSDPERLVKFLYSEDGNLLTHLFFTGILDIRAKEDDDFMPPEGFITFDNLYYIGIADKENVEDIEQLLRNLALNDHIKFQALLLGLQGAIPAEMEEALYREKGVRLAEEGYLPFEEAVSVYAYQDVSKLNKDSSDYILYTPDEETKALVPITPFLAVQDENLFAAALSGVNDYLLLDRIRLEFSGLCSQIFSADGVRFESIDDLVRICKKAGGYINIGLEKLTGGDTAIALDFVKNHPLITIFRAGFSQVLELRWKAEKWINASWFDWMELDNNFWGEERAGLLKGILHTKPLFYSEKSENAPYRDFTSLEEIRKTGDIIEGMMALDKLLGAGIPHHEMEQLIKDEEDMTFYQVLFTFWLRRLCGLEPSLKKLTLNETKKAFNILRKGETEPPYNMAGQREEFIKGLIGLSKLSDQKVLDTLENTLSGIWDEFTDEYAMINTNDLDPKYSGFVLIGK
ncbi:MAG: hypothetical protein JW927_07795 [Deltaproteobacteria bacterium]|nr:hypothetical protein [Deltaproteobacteria bacterium]